MKLVFLGPQGSGKGTQAARLSKKLGLPHISTGDMFRAAAEKRTKWGLEAKSNWEKGILVSDEVTIGIVKERLEEPDCANGWILDGFPRTLPQAEALDEFAPPELVIELHVPDEVSIKRISDRRVCKGCAGIYGLAEEITEQCKKCGGEIIQRDDDKPEAVKKRLQAYHNQTEPLLEYYKPRDIVQKVDGSKPPDEVFAELCSILE